MLTDLLLFVLDESLRVDDCRTGRLVMNMTQTFFRVMKGGDREYIQTHVRNHVIWKGTRFWEAAFFDAVQCEKQKYVGERLRSWSEMAEGEREESIAHDGHMVFGQLGSFAFNMLSFGVDEETTRSFVQKMCDIHELSDEYHDMLMSTTGDTIHELHLDDPKSTEKFENSAWKRLHHATCSRSRVFRVFCSRRYSCERR